MPLSRLAILLLIPAISLASPGDEFTFQSTAPAKDLLNPPRKAPADWSQRSGAVSINADWEKDPAKPWFIELQREGIRWVQCGLASDNKD